MLFSFIYGFKLDFICGFKLNKLYFNPYFLISFDVLLKLSPSDFFIVKLRGN